ncbi:MAG: efflux RND transporter periplasmic adaptor subunit [Nitrospirae bacterium]|nr:efflux RND transporter periplasmic adaptor subunit [Nitrospirota bacterium]
MMGNKKFILITVIAGFLARPALGQSPEMAAVVSKPVSRTITLPGEIHPFLNVALRSRVAGYVDRVPVDRGSTVKEGELLVELSAPEMKAQIAEGESKAQAAESDLAQAEAQLAAAQSTCEGMKKAAETPGAIAGNELIVAEKQVDAATALINSRKQSSRAAQASVQALKSLEAYLKITAPFDGVVTERIVHPGALVGPASDAPLLVLQQISHLRLTVAVPEGNVGGIAMGASVLFQVPAYPERNYSGTVARRAQSLDPKTRTMAVELDVMNSDLSLAPGMYATVKWPFRRTQPALYVPRTSVVTTTERTFVIREKNGKAEWVNVSKGAADGDLIEVIGPLRVSDKVVKRANDELREGTPLQNPSK